MVIYFLKNLKMSLKNYWTLVMSHDLLLLSFELFSLSQNIILNHEFIHILRSCFSCNIKSQAFSLYRHTQYEMTTSHSGA